MTLAQQDLDAVYASFVAELNSSGDETISVTRPDLKASIRAMDLWCDDAFASLNAAIPDPGRTELTDDQKNRLLIFILHQRLGV